jgi:hypothetical protein
MLNVVVRRETARLLKVKTGVPKHRQTWTRNKVIPKKPWKQEIAKILDCPRRKAVAEFRLCIGLDYLGKHLHCIGICPEPYCMSCSLREPMDRNHLGQCTALFNRTECERYWEARTKIMEIWLCFFSITILCDYSLSFWLLYLLWMFLFLCIYSVILTFYLYWSHRSMINHQCTCH